MTMATISILHCTLANELKHRLDISHSSSTPSKTLASSMSPQLVCTSQLSCNADSGYGQSLRTASDHEAAMSSQRRLSKHQLQTHETYVRGGTLSWVKGSQAWAERAAKACQALDFSPRIAEALLLAAIQQPALTELDVQAISRLKTLKETQALMCIEVFSKRAHHARYNVRDFFCGIVRDAKLRQEAGNIEARGNSILSKHTHWAFEIDCPQV